MNIAPPFNLNLPGKRLQQTFCRHRWPQLLFGHNEHHKTCACTRCGKTRTVALPGPCAGVLPTDYYGNRFDNQ